MSKWGQAKIEVIACEAKIIDSLKAGIPIKHIYEALKQKGKTTVTYNNFRRQVLPLQREVAMFKNEQRKSLIKNSSQSTPDTEHSINPPLNKGENEPKQQTQSFTLSSGNDIF